jgi:hypothetical protein
MRAVLAALLAFALPLPRPVRGLALASVRAPRGRHAVPEAAAPLELAAGALLLAAEWRRRCRAAGNVAAELHRGAGNA